jgi:hypothetical protein
MLIPSAVKQMIENDPDFVNLKRFDFSIEKVLDRYPDGVPMRLITQGLMMTEEEVNKTTEKILQKLRDAMGVKLDDE